MIAQPATGTIALYVDVTKAHARDTAATVARTLQSAGYRIVLCDEQNDSLQLANDGARVDDALVLITIGGDGTLLRAAQIAVPLGLPLLGVNSGRLGFLTELDATPATIADLPALLRERSCVDERALLRAEVHGRSYLALNDIVVKRAGMAHMTPFGIYVDGTEAAHVPADGIVISTPTGSTAYSLSAGGPIVAPDAPVIAIVALAAHTLFARPLVVADTSTLRVVCDRDTPDATLEADGRFVEDLHAGDSVTIVRHELPVRFRRRSPLNFFGVLEAKLRWNAPIKDAASSEVE